MGHIGEERLTCRLQLPDGLLGACLHPVEVAQHGDDAQEEQQSHHRGDDNQTHTALAVFIGFLQLFVVQLGVGLAQGLVHLGVVERVHHLRIAA